MNRPPEPYVPLNEGMDPVMERILDRALLGEQIPEEAEDWLDRYRRGDVQVIQLACEWLRQHEDPIGCAFYRDGENHGGEG